MKKHIQFTPQKYRHILAIRLTWADGMSFGAEIKGFNHGHALYQARQTWPDAQSITAQPYHFIAYSAGFIVVGQDGNREFAGKTIPEAFQFAARKYAIRRFAQAVKRVASLFISTL